jgi:hypothetical protein
MTALPMPRSVEEPVRVYLGMGVELAGEVADAPGSQYLVERPLTWVCCRRPARSRNRRAGPWAGTAPPAMTSNQPSRRERWAGGVDIPAIQADHERQVRAGSSSRSRWQVSMKLNCSSPSSSSGRCATAWAYQPWAIAQSTPSSGNRSARALGHVRSSPCSPVRIALVVGLPGPRALLPDRGGAPLKRQGIGEPVKIHREELASFP